MRFKIFYLLIALLSLMFLAACQDSDSDDNTFGPNPDPTPTAADPNDPPFQTITENFLDGPNGNLWKPVSENNGNLVVLFNPGYNRVFPGGCSVQLKDGSVAPLYCGGALNCFTNPNRLTLRSNVKCGNVQEVKVTCNDDNRVVIFTVPQELRAQVCSRHD